MDQPVLMDRFFLRLMRMLRPYVILLPLLSGIIWVMSYSLTRAGWVRYDTLIPSSILYGLVFGWFLSVSRFRGRWVLAYSLVLSFLVISMAMARLMPTIWQGITSRQPFPDLLSAMNIHIWTVLYRYSAWVEAIRANTSVSDTGLFIFLLSLLMWNATTWLVWCCLRTYRGYPGILFYGFLLALNVQLSGQSVWQFWFFLVLAVLLLIRTEYVRNHTDWDRRGVDYPDDIGYDTTGVAFGLAVLITSVALAASIIGTREGLRILTDLLSKPRQQTSVTAEKLFTGVKPPVKIIPDVVARTPDLQNFNSPLPNGKDVVMWVKTSDPAPPPPEALTAPHPPQRYWRNKIYTQYTPGGWDLLPLPEQQLNNDEEPALTDRTLLDQDFEILAKHDDWLYASNSPVQAGQAGMLRQDPDTDTILLTGKSSHYQVTSLVVTASADQLGQAGTEYPPEIRQLYLALPDTIPARVKSLTHQIASGEANSYSKALRIQTYLRSTYRYNLSAPAPASGQDFVDAFLFESQTGYCTHFATAMTVMLRLEGVPARVVTGFAMGEYNYTRQAYRVPADAAHAWVEVYFPKIGWVEFEPTPAMATFHYGEVSSEEETALAAPAAETPEKSAFPNPAVSVAVFCLLTLAGIAANRTMLHRRPVDGGSAGRLYWTIRGSMSNAGIPSSPATTPFEFLTNCAGVLHSEEGLSQVTREATVLYTRAVYTPNLPTEKEVAVARRKWRRVRWRWMVLYLKHSVQMLKKHLPFLG